MAAPIRVTWQTEEGVSIIAERQPGGQWEFSDKELGDVRWFPRKSTPALIATADAMLAQQTDTPAFPVLSVHSLAHPVPHYCRPGP